MPKTIVQQNDEELQFHQYQIEEALVKVIQHKGDFVAASKELGIPVKNLKRFAKMRGRPGISLLVTRTLEHMVTTLLPTEVSPRDWVSIMDMLLKYHLLLEGQATSRTEVHNTSQDLTQRILDQIPENQRGSIFQQTEALLQEFLGGASTD